MPHFVIECSENIISLKTPGEIMEAVYEAADASGLFVKHDIKVRINPYRYYKLGETKRDFIHVFGHIMEGRSKALKADLSRTIIERLNEMFPAVSILSMNVMEFELATYCNKSLIDPLNETHDRHF
ncbi:MAG: 5-carboxymethyl-2-hydroxymuconate Delta-isomerase [Chitinophagaceae bacterium]